ncbi:MAG: PKD domain-containing protein [Gammaproteobacteria bacterium]|nr:PKD domain-containing protein [Gammaproteobacteria bacterium]
MFDSASQDVSGAVQLAWQAPDDGGAPISGYRVYRGTASGAETLLATLNGSKTAYTDASALPPPTGAVYYYEISALNSAGEGPRGNELAAAQPVLPPSPCRPPGLTVVTDPSGDQAGAPANTEMDIQSLAIAEPYFTDGSQRLVFTLKVQDLSILPANACWKAYFAAPDGTTYFVDMNTANAQGTPAFEYGHVATGPSGSDDVVDGALDSDSGYSADGTIRLVAEDANVGGLVAGNVLQQVHATTQLLAGGSGTGVLQTTDTTVNGSYTLVGNASCKPNDPPVAALAASPTSGAAPLRVQFDGSGSYDPDGDSVAQYAFDFGDRSTPVTQSSPVVSHAYPQSGEYEATLTVTDSKGLASKNTSSMRIDVQMAPAGAQEMRGSGTVPVDVAGDMGRFDRDVTSVNTGRFHWKDKTHNVEFSTKAISGFSRLGNCVSFSGTGTLEEQGGSVSFAASGCDNGPSGSGLDTFSIQLSGAAAGSYSGTLQRGDLVLFVRGTSSGDND